MELPGIRRRTPGYNKDLTDISIIVFLCPLNKQAFVVSIKKNQMLMLVENVKYLHLIDSPIHTMCCSDDPVW